MVYTIEEIRQKVKPIAEKYDISALYLFRSYVRGEATEQSDVDVLFRCAGSKVVGLKIVSLRNDLTATLGKSVDLMTTESEKKSRFPMFWEQIERIPLYERT